jgi:hypothetical protein
MATSAALDRLDRDDVSSSQVSLALDLWSRLAAGHKGRAVPGRTVLEESPWVMCREELQTAMAVLKPPRGDDLRAVVAELDEQFGRRTIPNALLDDGIRHPESHWWWYRMYG